MSRIPTPRSYNQIVGEMTDYFLSRHPIRKLRIGSPVLSFIEAAAMSDVRASSDIFAMLASSTIESARGTALDRLAEDEDTRRLPATSASGFVTIGDNSFTKISTRVYQGAPAPLAGSTTLSVVDQLPATGSVYVGRGTPNEEGPLTYTSATNMGGYWLLTLSPSSYTQRFHNHGESVVLAQGGNRTISAGTVVQTAANGASNSVQFSVLYATQLPDGENEVADVAVVARTPGKSGNIPANNISSFSSNPFSGATVSNPSPFSNGRETETDDELRERLRDLRRSRSKGTALAIKTAVLGVTAPDENRSIISTSLSRIDGVSTLFIDDGTGYEEKNTGVAYEGLVDAAVGGETAFRLSQRPVSKAFVKSLQASPFAITSGSVLSVRVGGEISEHTFSPEDFTSITSANAFEVVSSINANPNLLFSARTAESSSRVIIFARKSENEEIQVGVPSDPNDADANLAFLFPVDERNTVELFKNDRLLVKDGREARYVGRSFGEWGTITGSPTLVVAVDGTPADTYTFTDSDFVSADTGFTAVGNNTPEAWAAVIRAKIPGVTPSIERGALVLTSNLGRSSRAKVEVTGGTLSGSMFNVGSATGRDADYTLNRATGELELTQGLSEFDRLSVGTVWSRGFIESSAITPVSVTATGNLWVGVDGKGQVIETGITSADTFDISTPSFGTWGTRYRVTSSTATPFFTDVEVGDWVVIWDPDVAWNSLRGTWRVVGVSSTWFEIERETVTVTHTGMALPSTGIAFFRYNGQVQKLELTTSTLHTADSFVEEFDHQLDGASLETYRTNRLRLSTNTHDGGDIALLAYDTEGVKVGLPISNYRSGSLAAASVQSGNSEIGTPAFRELSAFGGSSGPTHLPTPYATADYLEGKVVAGLRNTPRSGNVRFGNNRSFISSIYDAVTDSIYTRKEVFSNWPALDRFFIANPYSLGPEDDLVVVVDGDVISKRFTIPMWRSIQPTTGVYGSSNSFRDTRDGTATPTYLASSFGSVFDFNDFAVFMRARAISHSATANLATLWRYYRFGPEGEAVSVAHMYPRGPDAPVAIETRNTTSGDASRSRVGVILPSGAARSGYTIRNATKLGWAKDMTSLPLPVTTIVCNLPIVQANRTGSTVTLNLENPEVINGSLIDIGDHGLQTGDTVWVQSSDTDFPSGAKVITRLSAIQISYTEAGSTSGMPRVNIGTLSLNPLGPASFSGGAIAVGDIVRIGTASGIPSSQRSQSIRLSVVEDGYVQGYSESNAGSHSTTLSWNTLGDTTHLTFFPIDTGSATAGAIAAAVNAIEGSPIEGTVLGTGSGTVTVSTRDATLTPDGDYDLEDGINWVQTTTPPPTEVSDYTFSFKRTTSANLAVGADWANEEVRLVPTTAKNVVDLLNCLGVTGLSSVCEIAECNQGRSVQIASLTIGSEGAVQVQGGSANALRAPVVGSIETGASYVAVPFSTASVEKLHGDQWVTLDNSAKLTKSVFSSTTNLSSLTAQGVFTFSAGPVLYDLKESLTDITVQVEKHGRFVAIVSTAISLLNLEEGDWIYVRSPTTPTATEVDEANLGVYRVVRKDDDTSTNGYGAIYIENDSVVEQTNVQCDILVVGDESLMPGDFVSISTDLWGVDNKGLWEVEHVGNPAGDLFSDTTMFKVKVPTGTTIAPIVSPVGALGAELARVQVVEAQPRRYVKRVISILSSADNPDVSFVRFDSTSANGDASISNSAGTVLTVLDKLDFPSSVSQGLDGYTYSSGLIGEANRVLYGVESDYSTYPGVVAEGATVEISGPLVRRVRAALSLRTATGVSKLDVAAQVRSAVATEINQTGLGKPVAISSMVEAAMGVPGVVAVAVSFPDYSPTQDIIATQPHEKPLVLNVEQDISISFVDESV